MEYVALAEIIVNEAMIILDVGTVYVGTEDQRVVLLTKTFNFHAKKNTYER